MLDALSLLRLCAGKTPFYGRLICVCHTGWQTHAFLGRGGLCPHDLSRTKSRGGRFRSLNNHLITSQPGLIWAYGQLISQEIFERCPGITRLAGNSEKRRGVSLGAPGHGSATAQFHWTDGRMSLCVPQTSGLQLDNGLNSHLAVAATRQETDRLPS
jgi:hypothetical protein